MWHMIYYEFSWLEHFHGWSSFMLMVDLWLEKIMVGANLWLEHLHGWSIYGSSIFTVGAA